MPAPRLINIDSRPDGRRLMRFSAAPVHLPGTNVAGPRIATVLCTHDNAVIFPHPLDETGQTLGSDKADDDLRIRAASFIAWNNARPARRTQRRGVRPIDLEGDEHYR